MSSDAFSQPQHTALDFLTANRDAFSRDHPTIWSFHEPSWREYRSSQWYVDRLRAEGFEVEQGSAGRAVHIGLRRSCSCSCEVS